MLQWMWRVYTETFVCRPNIFNIPLETFQWPNKCALLTQVICKRGYMNHTANCTLRVWMEVWGQVSFAEIVMGHTLPLYDESIALSW